MIEMPKYKNPISLIPYGCPQLLDYEAPASILESIKYAFREIPEKNAKGENQVRLRAYRKNQDGDFIDEIDPSRMEDNHDYEISAARAIQPWLNQWLPVPFLKTRSSIWPDTEECRFEYGPANWSRARLCVHPDKPDAFRLVLAFDMQVEEKNEDIYPALTQADVDAGAHFRLAWRFRDNAWFMDLAWVEEWLAEIWHSWRKQKRIRVDEDNRFIHLANYLVYLEAIQHIARECCVFVVRPDNGCVDVDLVLDIGNSRTTGILVETHAQSATRLNNSYLLQLRNMDKPENVYVEPFETRVEFSEIHFGNDALSLRSGRKTPAFIWPSPVRIGPEAAELATLSRCEKGSTGMSSPKRYLWDERDWQRTWRFNTKSEYSPYVTRGPLAQQINSSGTPLCCMQDKMFTKNRILRQQEKESAFESLFTRSSLMMFLLVEIIQQALLTINAPGQRIRRDLPARPRRLRQIIFTLPSGMPMAEQKIYRRWGLWATHVLWEALGWGQFYIGQNRKPPRNATIDYRTSPLVRCDWDEATSTQLVFLYNEIVHKFQGDAAQFCELAGRTRNFGDHDSPSIRVAAIDVGGGTTDMAITTFELANARTSTPRLLAHPEFHDGFNLAGDDILRAVVAEHVLPAIGAVMRTAGIANPDSALTSIFGRTTMDATQASINKRIQFVRQVAAPAALCLLHLYENTQDSGGTGKTAMTLQDCFSQPGAGSDSAASPDMPYFPLPSEQALSYLIDFMREKAGIADFDPLAIPIVMDARAIDDTVRGTLKDVLANLCEVIHMYDCDALLLTGRPSCWPGIVNAIASLMPVAPSRIYPMADYKVGPWYPFSDGQGNITDPKTTVVTGAILAALAEGQLEGFSFDPRNLGVNSTARYIGEMELNGQIKKEKVWFEANPETNESSPPKKLVAFNGPISIGFRQLDAERWTTTRFYMLDYANNQNPALTTLNLPLQVKLKFELPPGDESTQERDEGEFEIEEIIDANGDSPPPGLLEVRLQTLPREDGFWLDTGIIYAD